ncbi:MAG TPA: universal stress protein [Oceanithermus profundus]|uniref:Universal stress protein n=1 Tax=Oceanithermus profundus TaxID=187137 RepID=A0A7C4ZFA2_9DEIN|nr:universal stress protein [Oceanithermus profundus]
MGAMILVPTDGSPCADKAVAFAIAEARRLGAGLTFLHVLYSPSTLVPPPEISEEEDEVLREAVKKAEAEGVFARGALVRGEHPVEAIVAESETGYDRIVMGRQGGGMLRRLLLGSTTAGVIQLAKVPVLVVPCDHDG